MSRVGLEKAMRAIRVAQFGKPEVLKVQKDVPVPKPEGKQVLIQVHAASVNPLDTYIRAGAHAVIRPRLPYTPGWDASGLVTDVGDKVSALQAGDRVYCCESVTGTYAEFTLAEERVVFPLMSQLSYAQGAAIGIPYHTAYRAIVHKCKTRPGETLLIHGASGAVGVAACQVGRAFGLHVLGTAGTEEAMELVRSYGAHQVFNHHKHGYVDEILQATKGSGVDVILEMLASSNLENDLKVVAANGRVAVIGSRGTIEITPKLTMPKEVTVVGVQMFQATDAEWRESAAFLHAGQELGWLRPVVGQEYRLEDADKAHEEVIEHSAGTKGKVVLKVQ